MGDICGDNRFEVIAKAKEHLLKSTNIHTSDDEMKVIDSFLFRCWQMSWLKKYDNSRESPDIPTQIKDFISLVKRMREAQEELDVFEHGHDFFKYEVIMKRKELISKVIKLESEVDEYLENLE